MVTTPFFITVGQQWWGVNKDLRLLLGSPKVTADVALAPELTMGLVCMCVSMSVLAGGSAMV